MENISLIGCLILGLICCLFGFKIQKGVIALASIIIGFFIIDWVIEFLGLNLEPGLNLVIRFGGVIVFGAFGFGMFETMLGVVVGLGILTLFVDYFDSSIISYVLGCILGVIGFIVTPKLYNYIVIIFSSVLGANLITKFLYGYYQLPEIGCLVVISIISILLQLKANKILKS